MPVTDETTQLARMARFPLEANGPPWPKIGCSRSIGWVGCLYLLMIIHLTEVKLNCSNHQLRMLTNPNVSLIDLTFAAPSGPFIYVIDTRGKRMELAKMNIVENNVLKATYVPEVTPALFAYRVPFQLNIKQLPNCASKNCFISSSLQLTPSYVHFINVSSL